MKRLATGRWRVRMAVAAVLAMVLAQWQAMAQAETDTAAMILDRYVAWTGLECLPVDSMLVMETRITVVGSPDTIVMRRWFARPQMQRVEVWRGKQLQVGLCTNGSTRYRAYRPKQGFWVDLQAGSFAEQISGYDCRGPLHAWRSNGSEVHYRGRVRAKEGQWLHAVRVVTPGNYDRDYLFEPAGLLAVILESRVQTDSTEYKHNEEARIEWKCIHEYQMVGDCLVPKEESFLRRRELTVLTSEASLEARRNLVFNQD